MIILLTLELRPFCDFLTHRLILETCKQRIFHGFQPNTLSVFQRIRN